MQRFASTGWHFVCKCYFVLYLYLSKLGSHTLGFVAMIICKHDFDGVDFVKMSNHPE